MASGDRVRVFDGTLINEFSWAGAAFPFSGADDVTISAPTTWNDSCGYKKVKKLTINSGQTLTIAKSPFFIFADEIAFGSTGSIIDASGESGGASTTFGGYTAIGGLKTDASARAQGGCGGGMLFIIARTITGANGVIKANGGAGYRNTTNSGGSTSGVGGQGALSNKQGAGVTSQSWVGDSDPQLTSIWYYLHPLGVFMADGVQGGTVVASGGGSGFSFGGGSGIGGGGGGQAGNSGSAARSKLNPSTLLLLAKNGCLGGGGGSGGVNSTGTSNAAGGGGGGSVVVWYRTKTATPTLEANGGTGATGSTANNGGAGVTFLLEV